MTKSISNRAILLTRALGLGLLIVSGLITGAHAQLPPAITRDPVSLSRSAGDRVALSVTVTGDEPLTYQWHRNGVVVEGAASRTLVFTNLTAAHAGTYTATISNLAGSVTSKPGTLDVDPTFTLLASSPVARLARNTIAWGDYDNDGLVDLFSGTYGKNLLFHNEGSGIFSVVGSTNIIVATPNGGDDMHSTWIDYNNDGNLDLLASEGRVVGPKLLFRGMGGGAFARVTDNALVRDNTATFSLASADLNRDGILDVFLSTMGPGTGLFATNRIYLGQPGGGFTRWFPFVGRRFRPALWLHQWRFRRRRLDGLCSPFESGSQDHPLSKCRRGGPGCDPSLHGRRRWRGAGGGGL